MTSISDYKFEYLLRIADDRLIMGQRLAEWCGVGPILEEDIALTNLSLDYFGQASALLNKAGEIEGKGRDEDKLAYFRNDLDFRNSLLVEQPNGDFAQTIAKIFLFSAFDVIFLNELSQKNDEFFKAFAQKSIKEAKYHFRHSSNWFLRLGDGTEESHNRLQKAVDDLWLFTGELFEADEVDNAMINEGIGVDLAKVKSEWDKITDEFFKNSTVEPSDKSCFMLTGGRRGYHTEHLGKMLAEMQILPRTYPDAKW